MDDKGAYILISPNQRYRDVQMDAVQMDAVQMDGSGTSEWAKIQIDSESPLIWTVQLDKRPNKHQ